VANVFAAARKDCETLGGAARLARRKVASVMAPTISPATVKQALVQAGGSVTGAARTLGIASASLRRLVRAQPLLADVVFEQIEREIDAAQQVRTGSKRTLAVSPRKLPPMPVTAARPTSAPWPIAGSALHRNGSGQAPRPSRTKARRPAHPGHAGQAETRGVAKPLQAQKASRRASVRTDQTGKRVQTIPVTRHRKRKGRMGADLHRAQPRQARPGCLSRLSFIYQLKPTAIWTGS
jgi:hypothetical protein